jgi:hypothetical protein
MLRSWGVRVQLSLVGEERPELFALGRELGLEGRVRFVPALGAADIAVVLAMRGQGSLSGVLAACCARGVPCVASASVAEGFDAPAWVHAVPDEPSPPLIAEAVLAGLDAAPGAEELAAFHRLHDPARCARLLCEALGVGA